VSVCRSCRASIRWATTLGGKPMPLDAIPAVNGNVRVTPSLDGFRAVVLAGAALTEAHAAGERLYYPHHGSCTHGKQWQRR
jgi:hypothetical protein